MMQRSWIWSLGLGVVFALVAVFIPGNPVLTAVAGLLALVNLARAVYLFIRDRRAQLADVEDHSETETGRHPEG
jgi:xanthosine utilization system XapX-like protein